MLHLKLKMHWLVKFHTALAALFISMLGTGLHAADAPKIAITPIIKGLDTPWAVAPLPEGGALITQRGGELIWSLGGVNRMVSGVPEVAVKGQGGLLDITLARDFDFSRLLFVTYAKPIGSRAATAVARAKLSADHLSLEDVTEIYVAAPALPGGIHFGSRVVQAADGTLFVSTGDRRKRDLAQDITHPAGSILRINPDGSMPSDNPFTSTAEAKAEIWSFGHRNPQGMDIDRNGNLWISEHGARGGDEVNMIVRGANFGWPVISYGREYSGGKIGEGTSKEGMMQPEHYWDPSIAPAGMLAYGGTLLPEWRDQFFVGSLKFDYIARLAGTPLREVGQIKTPETLRVRDVVQGPDGAIWFVSEGNGTVYVITPIEEG